MHLGKDTAHGLVRNSPSDSFQARLLRVFMYVCVRVCVCPCLLWNTVQISSACVRKGGRQVEGEKFHKSSYREVLLWRQIFQSFSWNLCSLHFPRFLPAQLIMKICFALGDDGSALIWFFMWEIEKICQKMCALRGVKDGADRRGKVFLKIWIFFFLKNKRENPVFKSKTNKECPPPLVSL